MAGTAYLHEAVWPHALHTANTCCLRVTGGAAASHLSSRCVQPRPRSARHGRPVPAAALAPSAHARRRRQALRRRPAGARRREAARGPVRAGRRPREAAGRRRAAHHRRRPRHPHGRHACTLAHPSAPPHVGSHAPRRRRRTAAAARTWRRPVGGRRGGAGGPGGRAGRRPGQAERRRARRRRRRRRRAGLPRGHRGLERSSHLRARARGPASGARARLASPGRSLVRQRAPAPTPPTFGLGQPGPGGWLRKKYGQQCCTPRRAPQVGSAMPGRGRHLRLEVVARLGLIVAQLGLDGHLRLVVLEHHVVVAHVGLRAPRPPRQAGRARGGREPPLAAVRPLAAARLVLEACVVLLPHDRLRARKPGSRPALKGGALCAHRGP